MAMKLGRSSKLEAVIGFDDCCGSTNSPSGAERFWIERYSMIKEKDKRNEKVKDKIRRQTRFEDNYSYRFQAMAQEMLVGIS